MPHVEPTPGAGGHNDQEGHSRGPKGPGLKASKSGMHDMQQSPHFRAPMDFVRYTTKELLGITTQGATNEEAVKPLPVPGNSRVAPSGVVIQGKQEEMKAVPPVGYSHGRPR
jgi:hypothetical protein